MIQKLKDGADVCYGQRTHRNGETKLKLITSDLYYRVFNYLSDIPNPRNVSNFRVFTRRVADQLIALKEQSQSLRSMVTFIGYKQVPMPFDRPERADGKTKYTFKKLISLAEDGIVAFSSKLPRLPIIFGIITGFLTLFFILLIP